MYAKARAGEIPEFTGISAPYEAPDRPELVLRPEDGEPDRADELVMNILALVLTWRTAPVIR